MVQSLDIRAPSLIAHCPLYRLSDSSMAYALLDIADRTLFLCNLLLISEGVPRMALRATCRAFELAAGQILDKCATMQIYDNEHESDDSVPGDVNMHWKMATLMIRMKFWNPWRGKKRILFRHCTNVPYFRQFFGVMHNVSFPGAPTVQAIGKVFGYHHGPNPLLIGHRLWIEDDSAAYVVHEEWHCMYKVFHEPLGDFSLDSFYGGRVGCHVVLSMAQEHEPP